MCGAGPREEFSLGHVASKESRRHLSDNVWEAAGEQVWSSGEKIG